MSGRLAYALAVIIVASPLIIVPSLYMYNQHRQHQYEDLVKADLERAKARMEAERLAQQNH